MRKRLIVPPQLVAIRCEHEGVCSLVEAAHEFHQEDLLDPLAIRDGSTLIIRDDFVKATLGWGHDR